MGHKMKRIFLGEVGSGRKGLWVWELWVVVGLRVKKTKRIKSLHWFNFGLHFEWGSLHGV